MDERGVKRQEKEGREVERGEGIGMKELRMWRRKGKRLKSKEGKD